MRQRSRAEIDAEVRRRRHLEAVEAAQRADPPACWLSPFGVVLGVYFGLGMVCAVALIVYGLTS